MVCSHPEVAVGNRREPQVTQVSNLSLLKVSVATAQPEGANYCECVFELAPVRAPWEAFCFFLYLVSQ